MAGEWRTVPLGEVAVNLDARRVPVRESDRVPGPYPYYGASGIVDYVSEYLFDGEYLLVAEDGENLRTRQTPVAFMATGKFWVNNHAHIIEGGPYARTRYLAYALSLADISAFLTGAVMPKLTQANLALIPIQLPSLKEQDAIVEVLSSLDDKIDLNRQMAATLEKMAQALFKSWFVNFDPVHAKAQGRDTCLPADIAEIFPNNFDEEGLPKGWALSAPTEFFDIVGGGTPNTKNDEFWGGEIPWYSIADAPKSGAFVIETEKSITPEALSASPARIVDAGTTIISARGTVGKLAIVGRNMAFNQSCYGLVPRDGFGNCFVYLTANHIVEKLKTMAHGAVFSTITRDTFSNLLLPTPPANSLVTSAFEHLNKSLFDQMLRMVQENSMLAALRDTLLPKLLSGELRVDDAADSIAAA